MALAVRAGQRGPRRGARWTGATNRPHRFDGRARSGRQGRHRHPGHGAVTHAASPRSADRRRVPTTRCTDERSRPGRRGRLPDRWSKFLFSERAGNGAPTSTCAPLAPRTNATPCCSGRRSCVPTRTRRHRSNASNTNSPDATPTTATRAPTRSRTRRTTSCGTQHRSGPTPPGGFRHLPKLSTDRARRAVSRPNSSAGQREHTGLTACLLTGCTGSAAPRSCGSPALQLAGEVGVSKASFVDLAHRVALEVGDDLVAAWTLHRGQTPRIHAAISPTSIDSPASGTIRPALLAISGCGTPMHAQSATCGWSISTSSASAGYRFAPPDTTMSLERSVMYT